MKIVSAGNTNIGRKRKVNQDSFLMEPGSRLFVVADGMGGHAGGETASRVAVTTIEQEMATARARSKGAFDAPGPLENTPLAGVLRDVVESVCAAVFHAGKANPELEGMGTTSIALLCHAGYAVAGHVGDSRLYIARNGQLQQLSEDHSLVNEQVKAGLITVEQARHSRFKNIITRSVGFEEDVLVDVFGVRLERGDKLLLCSDGLSNMVEDDELLEALRNEPVENVPRHLVDLANSRGGDDNITVIVVEVLEPGNA